MFSVVPPLMRSRPVPPKLLAAAVVNTPESMCSAPAPSSTNCPPSVLPLLPSLRSVSVVPSPTVIAEPAAADKTAFPPLPACM